MGSGVAGRTGPSEVDAWPDGCFARSRRPQRTLQVNRAQYGFGFGAQSLEFRVEAVEGLGVAQR